jgi:hypothetical protein
VIIVSNRVLLFQEIFYNGIMNGYKKSIPVSFKKKEPGSPYLHSLLRMMP